MSKLVKAYVKSILAKVEVRKDFNDEPYNHLEVEDWLALDEVKYALAREQGGIRFIDSELDGTWHRFEFDLEDGLGKAILNLDADDGECFVAVTLAGDPSIEEVDGQGDLHQAWCLFKTLPEDYRLDYMESLSARAYDSDFAFHIRYDVEPAKGPTPHERAKLIPRVGRDGLPQYGYDPLAASILRIGLPGGQRFLLDNFKDIAEINGSDVAHELRNAVFGDDVKAATSFAKILVDDLEFNVEAEGGGATVVYSAGGVSGSVKTQNSLEGSTSAAVLGILGAAEAVHSSRRRSAEMDREAGSAPSM